jgi:hypothetical protein
MPAVRYTRKQLNAYGKYLVDVVINNERNGTSWVPHPITDFKWDTCVICNKMIMDDVFGNNPAPVKDDGNCCSKCNREVVLPARVEIMLSKRAY